MYITRIEAGKGKKYKIFGEDEFLFALYGRELKHYRIAEHTEVEDTVIQTILEEIVLKRAKERALYLLERRPLLTATLKLKLRDHDYPEIVIEQVTAFLERYHYLDDKEYIRMYVDAYADKKSRKQIIYNLLQKGAPKDVITDYFQKFDYSEEECLRRQFERYVCGKNLQDYKVRQKIFRYFYGKGFQASLIEEFIRRQDVLSQ